MGMPTAPAARAPALARRYSIELAAYTMTCSPGRTPIAVSALARRLRAWWNSAQERRRSPSMRAGRSGVRAAWSATRSTEPAGGGALMGERESRSAPLRLSRDSVGAASRIGATPARALGSRHHGADGPGAPLPLRPLRHFVAHGRQSFARLPRDAALRLGLARRVRVWPERIGEAARREPRRLDGLLWGHPEHRHVEEDLEHRLLLDV